MIRAEILSSAGIDYSAGLERFMGDGELYEMVLAAFIRSDVAERARAAYDANDRETLLSAAHEAKGSSGSAGMDILYTEASALVKLLRAESCTDGELAESFLRFEKVYTATRAAVKAALQ